jgi:hypothetical protein
MIRNNNSGAKGPNLAAGDRRSLGKRPAAFGRLVSLIGIAVLVTVIGIGLAGCGNGSGDSFPPPSSGEIPSGTIKLEESSTNTFTVTLTGGLTWKEVMPTNTNLTFEDYLDLDGKVTADGADNKTTPAIKVPGHISFSVTRTNNTVLTVVMSQLNYYGTYHWGSGKLKLRDMDIKDAGSFINHFSIGANLLHSYTEQGSAADYYECDGKLTVADDSVSVNFDIPKHTGG